MTIAYCSLTLTLTPTPTPTLTLTLTLTPSQVRPERLAVLIFYSMLPNGEFDQTSLHAGCDVERGVKWAANFWFWNRPQSGSRVAVAQKLTKELQNRSMLRFERQAHPS